ncbi:MAG: peptidylprolyl isomerase [Phycisphaeraceae bacterium]|nr:peptidylprolyl isomerase [Phycisphaeraceae bacterium]
MDARAYHAMLAEAAGAVVLEEMVLDHELGQALREAGLSVSRGMIEQERRQMAEALSGVTGVPRSEMDGVIERVRASRGLGPVRFERLLERNAGLRALARSTDGRLISEVTGEQLEQAYAIRYGERVRARLILVRTEADAARALQRVRPAVATVAPEPFADVAMDVSIDPTASRGGLLDPVSPQDPSYPVSFRRAIAELDIGQVSTPFTVSWPGGAGRAPQQGLAIVQVVERIGSAGSPGLSGVRADLEREIRLVRERAAMDRIARELTTQGLRRTTVFDDALEWSRSTRLAE